MKVMYSVSIRIRHQRINGSLCVACDIQHVGKVRIQVDSLLRYATQNVPAPALNPKHI